MSTKLEQKIEQLTAKVEELKVRSHIDPMAATPEEIVANAQREQEARNSVSQLERVIEDLRSQLEDEVRSQKSEVRSRAVKEGFSALSKQSDRVEKAVQNLQAELDKLRDIGKAIASQHMRETGTLALDDRIPRDFRLPKVERLNNSVIVHTEARKLI